MDDRDRRDAARKLEVGTSVVAGSVGSGLGATKLRDAYAEEHKRQYANATRKVARKIGDRPAHFLAHAHPGFKPLTAGAATAITATAASKYRQKKDHEAARAHTHAGEPLEKGVTWAVIKRTNRRVPVLYQHSTNHFMVLDRGEQRLVHRDHIRIVKSVPDRDVAKRHDDLMEDVTRLDRKAIKLKAKYTPDKVKIVRAVTNAASDAKQDLSKAHDAKRGPRRRARAIEAASVTGAGVAVHRAVKDRKDANLAWLNAAGDEKSAGTNFRLARAHGGVVADHIKGYANQVGRQPIGRTGGRPVTRQNFGATIDAQGRSFRHLEGGQQEFARAFAEGQKGYRLVRRSNKAGLAAAGLAAVAIKAHNVAHKNRKH